MIQYYNMIAKAGEEAVLQKALEALAAAVRSLPGNIGVELLVNSKNSGAFTLIERWESAEAYAIGSKAFPKEALAPVMAALREPPVTAKLEPLLTV